MRKNKINNSNHQNHQRDMIALPIIHQHIFDDLKYSQTLDTLSASFEVILMAPDNIDKNQLEKYGRVINLPESDPFRKFVFDKYRRLKNFRRWNSIIKGLTGDFLDKHRRKPTEKIFTRILFLNKIGLGPWLIGLGKTFLSKTLSKILLPPDFNPKIIVIPTVSRDIVADDLVLWGNKNNIPTMYIQMNLDFFGFKTITSAPNYIGLWGDQSWYVCRLFEKMEVHRMKVIGSARFETHHKISISKQKACEKLDIGQNKKTILFCGGRTFKNEKFLDLVEKAITVGELPQEICILFKPHPKATNNTILGYVDFSHKNYKHIREIKESNFNISSPVLFNSILLPAVDAVITVFSTMTIEAGLHGKPILALQDIPENDSWWPAKYYIHTRPNYDESWALQALSEDEFLPKINQLIGKIGNQTIAEHAKGQCRNVAFWDDKTYGERLCSFIRSSI